MTWSEGKSKGLEVRKVRDRVSGYLKGIILDVGCGTGGLLRDFIKYGATPDNLYGIDLLEERIEAAKKLSPNINFICENSEKIPFDDNHFDICMQFTVFSSIFDFNMKKNIAKEMIRVLKSNGIILWYDFFYDNPGNPDVKGIKKKEIYELFSGNKIFLRRITPAPPLSRIVIPYSFFFGYLLESLKLFNTHYLGVIIKK